MNKKRRPSKVKIADYIANCPITQSPFKDPVVASDGHTYEREAIVAWMNKALTSPMTREEISPVLFPNLKMKQVLQTLNPDVTRRAELALRKIHDLELEHLASEVRTDRDAAYLGGRIAAVIRLQGGPGDATVTAVESIDAAYHYLVEGRHIRTDLPIALPQMPRYSSDIMCWCDETSDLVTFLKTTQNPDVLELFDQIEALVVHFADVIKERERLRSRCSELMTDLKRHVPKSALELCSEHSVLWENVEFATTLDLFLEPTYELDLVHGKMDDACRKYFKGKKL